MPGASVRRAPADPPLRGFPLHRARQRVGSNQGKRRRRPTNILTISRRTRFSCMPDSGIRRTFTTAIQRGTDGIIQKVLLHTWAPKSSALRQVEHHALGGAGDLIRDRVSVVPTGCVAGQFRRAYQSLVVDLEFAMRKHLALPHLNCEVRNSSERQSLRQSLRQSSHHQPFGGETC
jgi:hypothetical protein